MIEKDQAAGNDEQSKSKTLEELVDEGWAELESTTAAEHDAEAKAKSNPASREDKAQTKDAPKEPYKVLKVGGKDIPVASEEELIALAQKGMDYTQKTQNLSKDRKEAETKIKSEHASLTAEAKRLNDLLDKLQVARPDLWKKAEDKEGPKDDEDVFKEFDIDPETALPSEKKMASATANLRKELKALKELIDEERVSRAMDKFNVIVEEEKKKYPFEETFDEQGRPTHVAKLEELILAKKAAVESIGGTFDVVKSARESVKELYELQQSAKTETEATTDKTTEGPGVKDDMDIEEFKKKFPGLSQKLMATALAVDKEQRSKLPPTVKGVSSAPVTAPKAKDSDKHNSLGEFLDAGFNDPDIVKALQGE